MKAPPAYQNYAKENLARFAEWSNEAYGIYQRLRDFAWVNGSVPADLEALARLVHCDVLHFDVIWNTIKDQFEADGTGRHIIPEMEEYRLEQIEYRKQQSERGKKGMESRWSKSQDDHEGDNERYNERYNETITLHPASCILHPEQQRESKDYEPPARGEPVSIDKTDLPVHEDGKDMGNGKDSIGKRKGKRSDRVVNADPIDPVSMLATAPPAAADGTLWPIVYGPWRLTVKPCSDNCPMFPPCDATDQDNCPILQRWKEYHQPASERRP
jgi:hypothetical protein